jgi:starch phosphorylase
VGWAIGSGEVYDDPNYQDDVESNAIYNLLENEIVQLFYDVSQDGIPRKWVEKMKKSLSTLVPVFNTHRMVHEYFNNCYMTALERYDNLKADKAQKARTLTLWRQKIKENWNDVKIIKVDSDGVGPFEVGFNVPVTAALKLGKLSPDDVRVELYVGLVDASGELVDASPLPMKFVSKKDTQYIFEGTLPFAKSGRMGYSLRVIPSHPNEAFYQEHMLIKWA